MSKYNFEGLPKICKWRIQNQDEIRRNMHIHDILYFFLNSNRYRLCALQFTGPESENYDSGKRCTMPWCYTLAIQLLFVEVGIRYCRNLPARLRSSRTPLGHSGKSNFDQNFHIKNLIFHDEKGVVSENFLNLPSRGW